MGWVKRLSGCLLPIAAARPLNLREFAEVGQGIGHIGFTGFYVFKSRLRTLGGAASRPSSGERDKIVLAHPLQDQKYG